MRSAVFFAVLACLASAAFACSCLPRTFPQHYCDADVVLEVQFTSRREVFNSYIYVARIERVWKGTITTRHIQIETPKSSAQCGVTFLTGCNAPTYLITGRERNLDSTGQRKVVSVNSCDYTETEPTSDVLRFLRYPTCPCRDKECKPWQTCEVWENPKCANVGLAEVEAAADADGVATATGADGTATTEVTIDAFGDVKVDLVPCRVPYCKDTCDGFECPDGKTCKLRPQVCPAGHFGPCPDVATCVDECDACDLVDCLDHQECRIHDPTGEAFCADTCNDFECRDGYHCELVDVVCVRDPCPPVAQCVPDDDPVDVCWLPIDNGECDPDCPDKVRRRWAFDPDQNKCVVFKFEGCGGNRNNFRTEEECERACPPISPCRQPIKPGPCRASLPRWGFNQDTLRCEPFTYGGCEGNDNNFLSEDACYATCPRPNPCILPLHTGNTDATDPDCSGSFTRWYNNPLTRRCESFTYTGCGGNDNNFLTQDACEARCPSDPCVLPVLAGTSTTEAGVAVLPVVHWYYDPRIQDCRKFKYRGNNGNANRFATYEACIARCPPPNPCKQKPDKGTCDGLVRKWFFNRLTGQCELFGWSGCGGNRNRFDTQDECEERCPPEDVCSLRKDPGPCDAAFPRFWFNEVTKQCERFIYGGCEGNANNFETLRECLTTCREDPCIEPEPCDTIRCEPWQECRVHKPTGEAYCADTCNEHFPCDDSDGTRNCECKLIPVLCVRAPCPPIAQCVCDPVDPDPCELEPETGPCEAIIPRFYYDQSSGQCRRFIYGGCGGNANNFLSLDRCEDTCKPTDVCRLETDAGPCDGAFPRWTFNKFTGQCEQFTYGGCGGNRNRFLTEAACENTCTEVTSPCKLPFHPIDCRSDTVAVPAGAVYYDRESNRCVAYPSDKCPGNRNFFTDVNECEKCIRGDVCRLPASTGPCDGSVRRWFYDSNAGICRQFEWGGCESNGNNFESLAECRASCDKDDPCILPVVTGVCADRQLRFAHNPLTGHCQAFVYSGCEGNANNFYSIADCEERCPPTPCPGCVPTAGGLSPVDITSLTTSHATNIDGSAGAVVAIEAPHGWCCLDAGRNGCCCPAGEDRTCLVEAVWYAQRPDEPQPPKVLPVDIADGDLTNQGVGSDDEMDVVPEDVEDGLPADADAGGVVRP